MKETGAAAVERKNYGPGGRNSPFERFRNPQAAAEEDATDTADEVVEEPFVFENVMDAKEEACYSARYSDIPANMTANEHYARYGEREGRNIRCAHFMTNFMAKRYLGRYSALGNEFGREGKEAF